MTLGRFRLFEPFRNELDWSGLPLKRIAAYACADTDG